MVRENISSLKNEKEREIDFWVKVRPKRFIFVQQDKVEKRECFATNGVVQKHLIKRHLL